MDEEQRRRLNARYERTFGKAGPAAIVERVKAIIGTKNLPDGPQSEIAKDALDALKDPTAKAPTPQQFAVLETMLRMMRPALVIQNGQPAGVRAEFRQLFPNWDEFRDRLKPLSASVGRVELPGDVGIGTGFLVNSDTLVTNRHVLDDLTSGTDQLQRGQAFVNFAVEFDSDTFENPVPITRVKAIHETYDVVLLEIDDSTHQATRRPLTVASTLPELDDQVAAIGYPFDDKKNNPAFTGVIFEDIFGVKRAAPGEVVKISEPRRTISHDCSTLGGNSGSPVVSLKTGEVLGVHYGGRFLWRNEAVHCLELGEFLHQNGV